jgi:anti-sigma factor RsiW
MMETRHNFDESRISGYLDGELTQGEAQGVRVHLEDCAACRETADEMTKLKEVTMGSRFSVAQDTQWDERPRSGTSRLLRRAGLVIGLAWLISVTVWVLVELVGSEDTLGVVFVSGFLLSAGLILASALLDRREAEKEDPYRKVEK